MGKNRAPIKADPIDLVEAKWAYGSRDRVVALRGGAEVFLKSKGAGRAGTGGFVVIRRPHVKPGHKLGTKAKAMKSCAGLHGAEFGACLTKAGVRAPRSLGGKGKLAETE